MMFSWNDRSAKGAGTNNGGASSGRDGFWLAELLVVLAVISVMAAMLLPAAERSIASARQVGCANSLRQNYAGIAMYANDSKGFAPGKLRNTEYAGTTSHGSWTTTQTYVGPTDPSSPFGWRQLFDGGYAPESSIIGCPCGKTHWDMNSPNSTNLYALAGRDAPYGQRYNKTWGGVRAFADSANAAKVLLFEDCRVGLHWAGGNPDIEAALFQPNPLNWRHMGGGNIVRHDGAGMFLANSQRNPPSQYFGWPLAGSNDSQLPGYLDTLVR